MSAAGRRVLVTGLGLVSAVGSDRESAWASLVGGRTGIGPLTGFDVSGNAVTFGGQVDATFLDERQKGKLRRADRTLRFAVEAARQALTEAGWIGVEEAEDAGEGRAVLPIGNLWGCGVGPAGHLAGFHTRFAEKGPQGMRPSTVPEGMANSISAGVSIRFGLGGTNQVVVSACTSSTNAIGQAFRAVRHGYAEAVLCGGVDSFFDPFDYGVWNNLGVLSTLPDPATALRPFDAGRAGTLLGEGAAALLLESEESAARRGAATRGEVLGYGESSDATHITSPDVAGQVRAIRAALADAGVEPEELVYVNAHGTATESNDVTECRSIREALGSAAEAVPVGAMKSYFGHTLGASGALETVGTLLALEHGTAPPNLNLDTPDPECAVRLIGGEPLALGAGPAMKNSFGFGGGNGVLVLGRGA
ncbi:MAG: beta-ketoacyl-[acyl-carrier-protein] synthase family protein [Thermoanaerobaculia bacterium]